jgi:uncharacterized membrane protein
VRHADPAARYDDRVASRQIESKPDRTPILRKAVAGLVLVVIAAVVVTVVVHFVLAILWVVVAVAAVVAVLWALNTIL